MTTLPAFCCASMISSTFGTVVSAGFSTMTCLPASSASIATSPCRPVGTHTTTMSTSTSRSASASEVNGPAAALGGELLGPVDRDVDDGGELESVRELAEDEPVVRPDDAGADQGHLAPAVCSVLMRTRSPRLVEAR